MNPVHLRKESWTRGWLALFAAALASAAWAAGAPPTDGVSQSGVVSGQMRGLPPIRTYSFDEIGNVSTSVALGCDTLGQLTLVQQGTFLAFDERRWQELAGPQSLPSGFVKATAAPDGTMYWGASGDWGTYGYRSEGGIATQSLRGPKFPAWIANAVWSNIEMDRNNLLLWQFSGALWQERSTRLSRSLSLVDIWSAFLLGGRAFVSSQSRGLGTMDPDSGAFVPVPGLADVSGWFVKTVQWDEDHILAARRQGGFVLFDGQTVQPWSTEIDDRSGETIRALLRLPEGRVAVAVRGWGIYILERNGRVALALEQPLFSDVHNMMSTEPGVLWATTRDGLVKVLYGVPFEIFDHQSGLDLIWPHLLIHRGRFLVGTNNRLHEAVDSAPGEVARFRPLELPAKAGDIGMGLSTPQGLLLATSTGLWLHDDAGQTRPILTGFRVWRLAKGDARGDSVIAFGEKFLTALRWNGGEWEESGQRVPSIGYPSELSVPVPGSVWIELGVNRVGRVVLRDGQVQTQVFDHLADQVPDWLCVGSVGPLVVIGPGKGGWRRYFDERTGAFVDAPELDRALSQAPLDAVRPRQDAAGRIWVGHPRGVTCLEPLGDGRYRVDADRFRMLRDSRPIVEVLENGEVWTRSIHTLHRLNATPAKIALRTPAPVLVRVTDTRRAHDIFSALADSSAQLRDVPYRSNSLAFHLFPGTHGLLRNVSYRFKLEGYTSEWSEVDGSMLAFTNLKEGDYRLLVRAVEGGSPVGKESVFAFSIAPPLYRTWYAMLAYVVAAVGALVAGRFWVLRRAHRRQMALRAQIRSRTQELKQANESLQSALVDAQKATRAKGEFLARMSHEIRTPMNGVMGMVGELAATDLTREQREMCRVVQGSAESLMTIIDDILDFSKIESGKLQIHEQPLDLRQLVDDTVALFAPRARERGLSLVARLTVGPECWVLGDSVRLRQVLGNLVGNAIKFTARGGAVVRVDEPADGRFRFEVTDTGRGISQADQVRLFQPFEQLDGGATREHSGTGLGLAISRHLVELMGGGMGVRSRPREGACFWFELAMRRTTAPARSATEVRPIEPSRSLRLLVVDDDATNRLVAEHVLRRLGHRVTIAATGAQAIERLAAADHDVVLMDCQMPGLDGYETTRRIRAGAATADKARVPIIGLTAYALPEERKRGLAAGMNDYVAKPFKPEDLSRALAAQSLAAPDREKAPVARDEEEPAYFDPVQLASLTAIRLADGRPMAAELFRIFAEEMPATLATLRERAGARRGAELAETTHQLAGRAANLGARSVHRAANSLEQCARADDWEGAARALSVLEASWQYLAVNPNPWLLPS